MAAVYSEKRKTDPVLRAKSCKRRSAYYESNREREQAKSKEWAALNAGKKAALRSEYRARQRQASPIWADKAKTAAVYDEASRLRRLGLDVHVDHIIPLSGKEVCGLHVHQNLRIVFSDENLRKGSRFIEELLASPEAAT